VTPAEDAKHSGSDIDTILYIRVTGFCDDRRTWLLKQPIERARQCARMANRIESRRWTMLLGTCVTVGKTCRWVGTVTVLSLLSELQLAVRLQAYIHCQKAYQEGDVVSTYMGGRWCTVYLRCSYWSTVPRRCSVIAHIRRASNIGHLILVALK
jgi:hypothetical protein